MILLQPIDDENFLVFEHDFTLKTINFKFVQLSKVDNKWKIIKHKDSLLIKEYYYFSLKEAIEILENYFYVEKMNEKFNIV